MCLCKGGRGMNGNVSTCAVALLTQEVSATTLNTFSQDGEVGVLTLKPPTCFILTSPKKLNYRRHMSCVQRFWNKYNNCGFQGHTWTAEIFQSTRMIILLDCRFDTNITSCLKRSYFRQSSAYQDVYWGVCDSRRGWTVQRLRKFRALSSVCSNFQKVSWKSEQLCHKGSQYLTQILHALHWAVVFHQLPKNAIRSLTRF